MQLEEILNEGIKEGYSNGARYQTVILKCKKLHFDNVFEKYKIDIKSESHESQSYARLLKWTDNNGWCLIVEKNPKRDYQIDISYKTPVLKSSFKVIIDDLKKLIEHF